MKNNWRRVEEFIKYHRTSLRSSSPDKLNEFVELNGFNRVATPRDCERLKRVFETGRIDVGYYDMRPDRPPYQDHAILFKNTKTGLMCMVFHPYRDPETIRSEIEAWAEERELRAEIFEKECSWYYPGHTALVIISLPGAIVLLPERG